MNIHRMRRSSAHRSLRLGLLFLSLASAEFACSPTAGTDTTASGGMPADANATGGATASGGQSDGGSSGGETSQLGGSGGQASGGASGGTTMGTGGAGGTISSSGGQSNAGGGSGATTNGTGGAETNLEDYASGLDGLFMHDTCTGVEASQPDTCLHEQLLEEVVDFTGEPDTVYEVKVRVRGLMEPTTISGGETPLVDHPYFKVGGTVQAADYSQWHIEVSDPEETYWLNHYPSTSHTIYNEDFEATIPVRGGATFTLRVVDGNDRQIDNGASAGPDRMQVIDGVTDEVLDGQAVHLDVIEVKELETE